ncbi:diphosphomevalonate decarboxylase isoform X2 [Rhinichthys klamathensis goyatoka]|uniref:diphosphomevalonate decarboxylase isoform X2 n=1 Tax=Rhinichthys klamathensis goyatoka TaxID=3034132 RepID=UPI0024B5E74A|nr:diphosphomevalonate decarboxylase isoform X2 [Rhinichthys klamathensis goyatoka]
MGERSDGEDSIAEQVESESYWPELRVLILVVSAEQKSVGSTSGMHTSVETSQLLKVAYTFDAGPNAVIYTLQEHVPEFVQVVRHFFPSEANGSDFGRGLPVCSADLSEELKRDLNMEPTPKGIHYIISTKAGPGPCVVEDDPNHHLLGVDGLPKKSAVSD